MLRDLHLNWAWVVIFGNGLSGAWALAAHRLVALRTRALWWFTAVAQISIFVQIALGVALMNEGVEPVQFHVFYGFVGGIAVAIIYSYRAALAERRYLLYGFGGLFLMGLAIRAMLVGGRA